MKHPIFAIAVRSLDAHPPLRTPFKHVLHRLRWAWPASCSCASSCVAAAAEARRRSWMLQRSTRDSTTTTTTTMRMTSLKRLRWRKMAAAARMQTERRKRKPSTSARAPRASTTVRGGVAAAVHTASHCDWEGQLFTLVTVANRCRARLNPEKESVMLLQLVQYLPRPPSPQLARGVGARAQDGMHRSVRCRHAVAQLLPTPRSLSSKATTKSSLNLPKTSFPMHPNPALTEPPLLRRLSREHYERQACQHSNHRSRTCYHMPPLLTGDGTRGGDAICPA